MLQSRNYAPSSHLAPYIARHYVFRAPLPPDFTMIDRLLAETAFIRILITGDWAAETAPGQWERPGDVLFFGANARPFKVRVRGPFFIVGIALRPSGWRALSGHPASDFADRMVRLADVWNEDAEAQLATVAKLTDDDAIVSICEEAITAQLKMSASGRVNAAMQHLETVARLDSATRVEDLAEQLGISSRQLERLSTAHFGHTPKTVMRRSRFLDMAAAMRGLGDPDDEYLAALRYFDQSHRTREFKHFIGMTPAEFERTPTPLLDAGIQLRQDRKHHTY
ncbi:MAG: helix-turn-helix domain-containing protein [Sphingomonadaceae bacterium]|nr:helix-turn-helix domain-containing protein [Sphingomonadaceae bacterium]